MDWTTLDSWLAGSLNAPDIDHLGHWTRAELYQYAQEALQNCGTKFLLVAVLDNETLATASGQALYELPEAHVVTVYLAVNGETVFPASVAEMEALDENYEAAAPSDDVTHWIGNNLALTYIRLYPPPLSDGLPITLIYQQQPDLSMPAAGQPCNILLPAPIGDYLAIQSLEQARRRQGDGQLLDAAAQFSILGQLFEKVMQSYWGSGE